MRREALCRIPGVAGRNSEEGSWVQWLTRIRKVNGTIACQESDGQARVSGLGCRGARVIWRRLDCLIAQSPADARTRPSEEAPETGATFCDGIVSRPTQPLERGAMPSEGIEGDEWDAYVTLGRTTGTNAGSPTGREPYGDGVPVEVVGVTTHRGGRESRPQGEGAQVTGCPKAGRSA